MTVTLRPEPPYMDCLRVCSNLRQRDKDEIFAVMYGESPEDLARQVVNSGAFRWGAYVNGTPVALIGATPRWPNVWSAWAFGTDHWNDAILALTRHARRFMIPAIHRSGMVRMDAHALITHDDARKWLKYLGAEERDTLDCWGKNGETFVSYVWTREATRRLTDEVDGRLEDTEGQHRVR